MTLDPGLPITSVVVHPDGALITRKGSLSAQGSALLIRELPLLLDPTSVRVSLKDHTPRAVHVELDVLGEDRGPQPLSFEEVLEARRALTRTAASISALSHTRQALASLSPRPGGDPEMPIPSVERWLGWLEADKLTAERIAGLDEELRALEKTRKEQTEALAILEHRLSQESASEWWKRWQPTRRVRVELGELLQSEALEIELSYRVPGASWSPAYTLDAEGTLKTGRFSMRALIVQATGEDWRGVALSLCSAPAERRVDVPELPALRLGTRQPEAPRGWRELPAGLEALFPADLSVIDAEVPLDGEDGTRVLTDRLSRTIEADTQEQAPASGAFVQDARFYASSTATPQSLPAPVRGGFAMPEGMAAFARTESERRRSADDADEYANTLEEEMADAPAPPLQAVTRSARAPAFGAGLFTGGTGAERQKKAPRKPPPEPTLEVAPDWLDYGRLRLAGWDEAPGRRGRLHPVDERYELQEAGLPPEALARFEARRSELWACVEQTRHRPLPPSHVLPAPIGGSDVRIDAAGTVDIPSDGRGHSIAVQSWSAELSVTYRAVPRHDPRAFRLVTATVAYAQPLLPGPVDVYVDGKLELIAPWAGSPGRGQLLIGLGAEDRIKIARNVRYRESTTGLIGTSRKLITQIEVSVASSLPRTVKVEILERLPVPAEPQGITGNLVSSGTLVEPLEATPPAYPYKGEPDGPILKGGRRQVLELAPGGEARAVLSYAVTLGKNDELVGGDRRG